MRLEKETLNSLSKQMELVAKTYFAAKSYIHTHVTRLNDSGTSDAKHRQTLFIKKVQETYDMLNPIEQLFINNDFFYEEYPNWWKDIYSKNQYQLFKKRAIIHFLRIFYDED